METFLSQAPFHRYSGAVDGAERRMPQDRISASTSPRQIGELLGRMEKFTADDTERKMYPWAERFIMGYPLAPWQRPVVWTAEQMSQFITSIWMDVDLGSYLVNDVVEYIPLNDGSLECQYLSDVLLDGQQRLSAIEAYVLNRVAVPDANGVPSYWSELSKVERRFFCNKTFSMSRVASWDEELLRHVYNLRAFGGVRHSEDQRA